MQQFTTRQLEILAMIRQWIFDHGRPPTRSEIANAFGFKSPNAAEQHLKALARKGALTLQHNTSRGIQLAEELLDSALDPLLPSNSHNTQNSEFNLPVIGRVAAGMPILAQEHVEMYYQVDPNMFRPKAHYLLRVQGVSMHDIGIMHNDLLAVHQVDEVHNGQIVVARIEDEVTVKRFQRVNEQFVRLLPENPKFKPIEIDLSRQSLVIEGLGVGVLRTGWPLG